MDKFSLLLTAGLLTVFSTSSAALSVEFSEEGDNCLIGGHENVPRDKPKYLNILSLREKCTAMEARGFVKKSTNGFVPVIDNDTLGKRFPNNGKKMRVVEMTIEAGGKTDSKRLVIDNGETATFNLSVPHTDTCPSNGPKKWNLELSVSSHSGTDETENGYIFFDGRVVGHPINANLEISSCQPTTWLFSNKLGYAYGSPTAFPVPKVGIIHATIKPWNLPERKFIFQSR